MICRKVTCPGSKILPTIVAGALAVKIGLTDDKNRLESLLGV